MFLLLCGHHVGIPNDNDIQMLWTSQSPKIKANPLAIRQFEKKVFICAMPFYAIKFPNSWI